MYIDENDARPQLVLIGGSNGSGKTTLAEVVEEDTGIEYLGADRIAASLDPAEHHNIDAAAGRIFVERLRDILEAETSVIIESTLAGTTLRKHLVEAKERGYKITILYIFLSTVELSLFRIEVRVRGGGHNVPEDLVRVRYLKSRINFWNIYRQLADNWELIYNSPNEDSSIPHMQHIATMKLDEREIEPVEIVSIKDRNLFEGFLDSFGGNL